MLLIDLPGHGEVAPVGAGVAGVRDVRPVLGAVGPVAARRVVGEDGAGAVVLDPLGMVVSSRVPVESIPCAGLDVDAVL